MDIIKKRIGIIGGGQLGKMMILEAKRLGFYVVTLDPAVNCPAHSISDEHIVAPLNKESAYYELVSKVDVVTYEFEHINTFALEILELKGHTIYPSVRSLKIIQNKLTQKEFLHKSGIPVPQFIPISSINDIKALSDNPDFAYPIMLKNIWGGYDGKGNALISDEYGITNAFESLGANETLKMAEKFISYEKEISIIATRGINGERVIYPPAENSHKNSILDVTIAPARISDHVADKAKDIAGLVMDVLEGVGTFCVEMFLCENGDLLVNEVAPRPHNSGHYTIEACFANQFENHIRAITGLPLGSTDLITPAVMINLLGESNGSACLIGLEEAYKDPNIHVHLYGKSYSATNRKMGHITAVGKTVDEALERAISAKDVLKIIGEVK
jgi:5-(carboxyamino)imidazole ribonucleotide synthase